MLTPRKQQRLSLLQYRIARAQRRIETLRQVEAGFPWYRLAALVIGAILAFMAFNLLPAPAAWGVTGLALAGFILLSIRHNQVIERIARLETFCHLLATHIARLNLDWERIPAAAEIPVEAEHPFAADLNILGSRSLHQLLDTAISQGGSQRLASWLLATQPDPPQISQRQQAVREMLSLPGLRLCLELNGLLAHPERPPHWDTSRLQRWLKVSAPGARRSLRLMLIALSALAGVDLLLLALNLVGLLPPFWIATFVIYLGGQAIKFRETSEVFDQSYSLARMLGQLLPILSDLEIYPYPRDSRLASLAEPVTRGVKLRPSTARRRIAWINSAASLRGNPFLSLILNFLMPWDLFFAYQLERYKDDLREDLPAWLDTWYVLEALASLANYAALNPDNTFPEITALETSPILQGQAMGHPLIHDEARVTNDFSLQRLGEVVIITGSNMSGKSTFLRTLGANLVLNLAGESATRPVEGLDCVLAAGAPIDLAACARWMDHPSRRFYDRQFLYSVIPEVQRLHDRFPELGRVNLSSVGSILEFDRSYTAPRNGFTSVEAYYHECSPIRTVGQIAATGLVIHAKDDPFIPLEPFLRAQFAGSIEVEIYPRGGHLGFISRKPWAGDRRWLVTRLAAWLAARWDLQPG